MSTKQRTNGSGTAGVTRKLKIQRRSGAKTASTPRANKPRQNSINSLSVSTRLAPMAIGTTIETLSGQNYPISRREFLGSVTFPSNGVWTLSALSSSIPGYDLNPGNSLMFPWLGTVANHWEKYRFTRVKFDLIARNSTLAVGKVGLAFDYDWNDPLPSSEVEFFNTSSNTSANCWESLYLSLNCPKLNEDIPWRYTSVSSRADIDQRTSNAGYLMLGCQNSGGSDVSFDLYIDYSVILNLPCLPGLTGGMVAQGTSSLAIPAGTGKDITMPTLPGLVIRSLPYITGSPTPMTITNNSTCYPIPNTLGALTFALGIPAAAGTTPASYMGDTKMDFQLLDSAFNFLVDYANLSVPQKTNGLTSYVPYGASDPTKWTTNGEYAASEMGFNLNYLKAAFPSAAYIVPYIFSTAGRASFNQGTKVSYAI